MSYMLEALSGSVQASALDLSQNGIATLVFQDKHRRLYHVSTLMVGRLGDLWEWIVLNHQQVCVRWAPQALGASGAERRATAMTALCRNCKVSGGIQ